MIANVQWSPQTDETHDGILKDMFLARDAKTMFDASTGNLMLYFLFDDGSFFTNAKITLANESGKLVFESDEQWDVKFSEKNEILYMTITDSNGKTVYYQQK